jgi:uncharacterized protein YqhQ
MRKMELKIGELITQTNDIQFFGIYKEFLSFKRKHFVEYHLLKKIPLIDNLMQIIEIEMDKREDIEKLANEIVEEIVEEKEEENWKKEWRKENETNIESSLTNDFKKILIYVACFHVCIFGFFIVKSFFKEENFEKQRIENLQETLYKKPAEKGVLSDAIGKKSN